MKILYIGHYRDSNGWGIASLNNVLALDKTGFDLVIRPIKYNKENVSLPDRILELESKPISKADIIVQNTLPQNYSYQGPALNIGWYFCETNSLEMTEWVRHINLMDHNFVHCEANKSASIRGGVKTPISVIPCSIDPSTYYKSYSFNLKKYGDSQNNTFKFYTIAEGRPRKNLGRLITAFHLEFSPSENVELIVQSTFPGHTPQESLEILKAKSLEIRSDLNLNYYKDEVFITDRLSPQQIYGLHQACDCFVSSTYAEGWGLPIMDSLFFGKTPIVTNSTAMKDYIGDGGWLVDSTEEPVMRMATTHSDLYYGQQTWDLISMSGLRTAMRQAFENKVIREFKSRNGIRGISHYSHGAVGEKLKNIIENLSS